MGTNEDSLAAEICGGIASAACGTRASGNLEMRTASVAMAGLAAGLADSSYSTNAKWTY